MVAFLFAWYQVGSAANATGKAAQYAQFTASTDKKNAGTLSFVLSVTLTPVGNSENATDTNVPANLQMVNFYNDSGTIKKQFGYYVQGESSPRYQDSGWGESPYWIVYKARVSVTGATIEGVTYSDAEAGHLLNAAGETYTLTVSADGAFTAVENATAEEVANYNAKYGASYSEGDTLPALMPRVLNSTRQHHQLPRLPPCSVRQRAMRLPLAIKWLMPLMKTSTLVCISKATESMMELQRLTAISPFRSANTIDISALGPKT